jgi:nucleotide-binding universal stress UspA family protein
LIWSGGQWSVNFTVLIAGPIYLPRGNDLSRDFTNRFFELWEHNMSTMIENVRSFERRLHPMPVVVPQHQTLRVFIPYDGSETSEAVLNSLKRAGLPRKLEALVAVTQVWLPSSPEEITRAVRARQMKLLTSGISSFAPALRDDEEQQVLSREADERIRSMFPSGSVKIENMQEVAAVARDILRRAKTWGAELIILGSKTSPSPDITDYCGPALRVAQDAHCSVRIVRASDQKSDSAVRIMIAVDESDPTDNVAQVVASRSWPAGSEATIVAFRKNGPRDLDGDAETTLRLQRLGEKLRAMGLGASFAMREGIPREVLLREARELSADCIFIDAQGFSQGLSDDIDERRLSKVAEALVIGAHCSVEVVRARSFSDESFKTAA